MQGDIDDALASVQGDSENFERLPSKMRKDTCDVLVKVALGTLELQSDAQRQYV